MSCCKVRLSLCRKLFVRRNVLTSYLPHRGRGKEYSSSYLGSPQSANQNMKTSIVLQRNSVSWGMSALTLLCNAIGDCTGTFTMDSPITLYLDHRIGEWSCCSTKPLLHGAQNPTMRSAHIRFILQMSTSSIVEIPTDCIILVPC